MHILRGYQQKFKAEVFEAWHAGHRNVCGVMPTGAGKTKTLASILYDANVFACVIAHRQELVGQLSVALAEQGIFHRIVGPKKIIQFCIKQHIKKVGRSFYHANANVGVAGIDTLIRRGDVLKQWLNAIKLWALDECHHLLRDNKWGIGVAMMPNAFGLGLTATPIRADRKSLGRSKSGLFDTLVQGPTMRDLISWGFLAPYKIFGIEPSFVMTDDDISATTGDYSIEKQRKKAHASKIVGDVVQSYLNHAPGKLGLTFSVDVELAKETADAYNHFGVPAMALSADTPDDIRMNAMEKFGRGEYKQLTNVDLFSEGLDVPGVEVVSDGAKSLSFSKYSQRFGRMIRPAPGKSNGIYIDHVGNVLFHRLPDAPRIWSLDDVEKGKRGDGPDDAIPLRICTGCRQPYEAIYKACPHCGHVEQPLSRSAPEHVDGDVLEYGPELIQKLGGLIADNERTWNGTPQNAVEGAMARNMKMRSDMLQELRTCIAYWAGIERDVNGLTDSQAYRKFYHQFNGVDVMTAQTLDTSQMRKMITEIRSEWV